MKFLYENQAAVLKAVRTKHGKSQTKVAEVLKVHLQYISNCERAVCGLSPEKMRIFVKKFGGKEELALAIVEDGKASALKYCEKVLGK